MIKKYNCYLFDADGTLIDTTELIYQCFVNTARVFGKELAPRNDVVGHIGLTLRDQMTYHFGVLSGEQYEQYRSAHMDYQLSVYRDYLRLFPGVAETLCELRARGSVCMVVSSRMRPSLELYLKETGILPYFDDLITPELTERHKPDPEPALKAMAEAGAGAEETLFIGDAPFDIECGHAAGTDTALVGWSAIKPATLETSPTYILTDMRQLCEKVTV